MKDNSSAKTQAPIMIAGGIIGAIAGLVAARLWIRADGIALDKDHKRKPQGLSLSPAMLLTIALSLLKLFRQINSLSSND